ncbi:MAG: DUF427 domain-containing protein [bacterium]
MAKAMWNDAVLAESDKTIVVEGNHYFPPESVHREYLVENDHQTNCPWKGTACYYDVKVGDKINENAAWYYPQPKDAAEQIKGYVAFWKGVRVEA